MLEEPFNQQKHATQHSLQKQIEFHSSFIDIKFPLVG